jgi:hypothetical protein
MGERKPNEKIPPTGGIFFWRMKDGLSPNKRSRQGARYQAAAASGLASRSLRLESKNWEMSRAGSGLLSR